MRIVTTEYPVYNAWIQRPFELEDYTFTPSGVMAGYQERVRALLASPEDSQTVDVVRIAPEGAVATPAYLWDSGTAFDDYLLLLSLGQGRNVHYKEAHWTTHQGKRKVAKGVTHHYISRALIRGEQAISPFEVEPFLQKALTKVRTPGWVEDTGFDSGVLWYLASLAVPNHEHRYLSAWHGLSAVVRRYFQQAESGNEEGRAPSEFILAFRDAHNYDFILDEHPPIWEELSQDFTVRHPRERVFTPRHAYIFARKLQIVLLLVLLDLVETPDFARRASLLRDIRR